MKLILSIILMLQLTYHDGWKKGYIKGWCYQDLNCIEPIVPISPIPKLGFDTYKDGYNDGFLKGKKDRK